MPHDPLQDPPPDNLRPENAAPPLAPVQAGSPFRRVLPWVLSAAAVLGLLLVMLFAVLPRLSQVPRSARNPPLPSGPAAIPAPADPALPPLVPAQPSPAKAAADGQVPLAVALYSAGSSKHVPVGQPVLISAYAALPPAGSATIAISYTRNGGPRSLLTLAQGSLSTASWTPAAPGRYNFTASALDSRKISAFSHSLVIVADAAPSPVTPLPAVVSPAPPARTAALTPAHRAKLAPRRRAAQSVPAARPVPNRFRAPNRFRVQTSHLKAYHVAAAAFVVRPVAETLAGALRRRGFHAFVRETTEPHHKPTYVVETGKFLRPADAKKQLYTLNHDGYPAFVSQ